MDRLVGEECGAYRGNRGDVDGYRFFVHPIVSVGAQWFDQVDEQRDLELVIPLPTSESPNRLAILPDATHYDIFLERKALASAAA